MNRLVLILFFGLLVAFVVACQSAPEPAPTVPPPTAAPAEDGQPPEPTEPDVSAPADNGDAVDDAAGERETNPAAPAGGPIGAVDPAQIIADAEARAAGLVSLKVNQTIRSDFAGTSQLIQQDCDIRRGNDAALYCASQTTTNFSLGEVEPAVGQNEIVQLDNVLWVRQEDSDWQRYSEAEVAALGFNIDNLLQQMHLSRFVVNAVPRGQSTLDGVEVLEVGFTINVPAYYAFLLGDAAAAQLFNSVSQSTGQGSVWIGQLDRLPRRILLTLALQSEAEQVVMQITGDYSAFNQPVTIPDPAAGGG